MSEDRELTRLENEWKNRFDRFTAPEPSREQTLDLLQKIKAVEEVKPVDLRFKLESHQDTQSMSARTVNLFLSQWNFHGTRSWLLTGIIMLILTLTISQNIGNEVAGFSTWIKWVTLFMIAVMGYAFRTKNEGNQLIETLSYYPLTVQMFMRFMIVMALQLAITLPLSFIILGATNSIYYLLGSFTPVLFFGVIGFVSTIWLGQKIGLLLALFVWFSQTLFEKQHQSASLFQLPENEGFLLMNIVVMGISILLLGTVTLKYRQMRDLT
ncbi:hypothetical protein [Neobacillus sp. FSL H8-0543]|uniref:hypothetical protein n=1 Tax=Neobacillus sp. FSL H8-0543 TaxID=2954672 RepID=UPI003158DA67